MGDTYILKQTGDKVAQAIENALQIDDKLAGQKSEVDKEVVRIEAIAKGRATGYVFDTESDMHKWLGDSKNVAKLVLGDNLYIRVTGVPDYWWDGESPQLLETQKIDLTEYAKKSTTLAGYGIEDAYTKTKADQTFQKKLTSQQIEHINDVPNKVDAGFVGAVSANALKGTVSGEAVAITDVSPIEYTMGVKVRSKNMANNPVYRDVPVGDSNTGVVVAYIATTLEKGKTYTMSFDTENTGAQMQFVSYGKPLKLISSQYPIADGTRKSIVFSMTDDYYKNFAITWIQLRSASTANSGLCSNVQLEEGSTATAYTPFVEDISAVSLKKYGKNILDINNPAKFVNLEASVEGSSLLLKKTNTGNGYSNAYFSLGKVSELVGKTFTVSCKNENSYRWTIYIGGIDSSNNWVAPPSTIGVVINGNTNQSLTFTVPDIAGASGVCLRIQSGDNSPTTGETYRLSNIQVEVGAEPTDYEPCKESTTYIPNTDGTVEGVTSVYPTTTLIADTGVVIDCDYNRDLNKAFEQLVQAVISLGGNV